LGSVSYTAIMARDIPLVQGCVLYVAVVYVLVNLVVDLMYGVLDPRIRLS
jgi:peptide/nickel transport system permease protein